MRIGLWSSLLLGSCSTLVFGFWPETTKTLIQALQHCSTCENFQNSENWKYLSFYTCIAATRTEKGWILNVEKESSFTVVQALCTSKIFYLPFVMYSAPTQGLLHESELVQSQLRTRSCGPCAAAALAQKSSFKAGPKSGGLCWGAAQHIYQPRSFTVFLPEFFQFIGGSPLCF